MWLFQVLSSIWFGYELVTFLASNHFDGIQRIFCGLIIGFVVNGWLGFIISYFLRLSQLCGLINIFILSSSASIIRRINVKNNKKFIFYLSKLQIFTYTVFAALYFIFMYSSQLYDYRKTKGAGYSDMPFHLGMINSFAVGCNNQRDTFGSIFTVFFSGTNLAYPFIPNFYTAMLVDTGFTSNRFSLLIPSTCIVYSFLIGLYSLIFYYTKSHIAGLIGLILFTNLGGLGWTHYFDPKHRLDPRRDWIHDWGNDQLEYWFHPIMHILIPQRAALWSLPLCTWATLCLIIGVENHDIKFFILAAIMTGLMPQVQVHSYVSIAQYAVGLCLCTFPFKNLKWRRNRLYNIPKEFYLWVAYAIIANAIAFPQLAPYFMRVSNSRNNFLLLKPIWVGRADAHYIFIPIRLWWRGLGVFAAIALVFGWAGINEKQKIFYYPAVMVFILTNIIRYQPWELDNTKLFYAAWVPLAICVVSQYLTILITHPKTKFAKVIGFTLAVIFILASTISAFMSTVQSMFWNTRLYEYDEYKFGLWIAENTPPNAVFMLHMTSMNPVSAIAGRQLFIGYSGWVHSHGLDVGRLKTENELMNDPENIANYKKYNISYVGVCAWCQYKSFKGQNSKHWKLVFSSNKYKLYRLIE